MSIPFDKKKRETAIQERREKKKQPICPDENLNYKGSRCKPINDCASSSSFISTPSGNIRSRSKNYYNGDYTNFTWDEWVGQPLPPFVHFAEIKISTKNLLPFHGRDHFLSTFYPVNFIIEGHQYYSVEGYYEAVKVYCNIDVEAAQKLSNIRQAAEAKRVARKLLQMRRIPRSQIEHWKETQGVRALYNAVTAKFTQSPVLREQLKATGEKLLVHSYPSDCVFASGCTEYHLRGWAEKFAGKTIKIPLYQDVTKIQDYLTPTGAGKNILGYITMRIRAELNAYDTSAEAFARLNLTF